MAFVCECGFRAELSAQQRQRLAASGGRAKCPKCGKSSAMPAQKPSEQNVQKPQATEPATEPENTADQLFGFDSAKESQPAMLVSAVSETPQTSNSEFVSDSVKPTARHKVFKWQQWAIAGAVALVLLVFVFRPEPSDVFASKFLKF